MSTLKTEQIASFDGTELAVHRLSASGGAARPVVLLHGLFSSAQMNWIRFGHAQALADAGFEAIMPDLRAHGQSDAPHEAAAYPPDVLVRDVHALVERLTLTDYDLVGFSLGARTAARAVIEGLSPRRLVLAGMGIEGLSNWRRRSQVFLDAIDRFEQVKRGEAAFFAVQFMKTMKIDRVAARLLLGSVQDIAPEDLSRITMPILVLIGDEDRDNGSPERLAQALPDGRFEEVPGNHMGSVTKPDLGRAIARFLSA
jgi:pimeloyl-ACP methyl ester carboxylesterase